MNLSGKNNSNPASELEQNLEFLRQTYFFSGIPLEALKVFAYLCTREKFKAGEYLFRQGEDDGQAFYIIEGKAVLEYERNGDTTMIRDCDPGEFLGGLTLVGDMRRLFSLKASTDTTCLILNREKFTKAVTEIMNKKIKSGLDRPNYPQTRDIISSFFHLIENFHEQDKPWIVKKEFALTPELFALDSIAKKYSELHGGSLDVRSMINEGSTFYFTIPLDHDIESKLSVKDK